MCAACGEFGMTIGSVLFGEPGHVEVTRGLAELKSGRPVLLAGEGEALLVLPVDNLDPMRLAAFAAFCASAPLKLIVTAPRARALGIDAQAPVALPLPQSADVEIVSALATDTAVTHVPAALPTGETAAAALALIKLAQGLPAVLAAEIPIAAATRFEPPVVIVDARAVARFRDDALSHLTIAGEARVPLRSGTSSRFIVFRDAVGETSVAVIVGDPDFSKPVLVRLHSACLTGDVFGSRRCDCGDQLALALANLEDAGGGVILYLPQEGRGVGLAGKMRAYELQDEGLDTVDANTTLGFNDDERDYRVAGRMLNMLGCSRVVLLTNNPSKLHGLAEAGIDIAGRAPIETPINAANHRYLAAKAVRAGHRLDRVIASLREEANAEALSMAPVSDGV